MRSLFSMIAYSFGLELEELGSDFPSQWNYISSRAWEAMDYLRQFQIHTASDGCLIIPTSMNVSGDLTSETVMIHGITSYLAYTSPYLLDPHFPIIYKCIAINYAVILLVRLHPFAFKMVLLN